MDDIITDEMLSEQQRQLERQIERIGEIGGRLRDSHDRLLAALEDVLSAWNAGHSPLKATIYAMDRAVVEAKAAVGAAREI